jgi:two-component system, NarL family, invasion response regulator UvrY
LFFRLFNREFMKILICDDHKILRDGLRQILQQLQGTTIIAEAGDAEEALALLKRDTFDIILLDISLPGRNGLEVLQLVKEKWPSTKVLILSMQPQELFALRALKLGASGYLTKDAAMEELLTAVKRVSEGEKYISSSVEAFLVQQLVEDKPSQKHNTLSPREFEIMIRLANGESLMEIGDELSISNKTVGTYRTRIMEKMDLTKNIELTWYCMENKLI